MLRLMPVALATSIMRYVHWFGLDGWRWVFILEGVPAILMGIFVLIVGGGALLYFWGKNYTARG